MIGVVNIIFVLIQTVKNNCIQNLEGKNKSIKMFSRLLNKVKTTFIHAKTAVH